MCKLALMQDDRGLARDEYTSLAQQALRRAKLLRGNFLHEVVRSIRDWRQRQAAIRELHSLDDAALKDIGLHRSNIETAVR